MFSRVAAAVLTGPLAFLVSGLLDVAILLSRLSRLSRRT
jgi:hypothetical protein